MRRSKQAVEIIDLESSSVVTDMEVFEMNESSFTGAVCHSVHDLGVMPIRHEFRLYKCDIDDIPDKQSRSPYCPEGGVFPTDKWIVFRHQW
jgi:hypothetical protein